MAPAEPSPPFSAMTASESRFGNHLADVEYEMRVRGYEMALSPGLRFQANRSLLTVTIEGRCRMKGVR